MFDRFRRFCDNHFGVVMISAFVLGLIIPRTEWLSADVVTLCLILTIFLSCFKVDISRIKKVSLASLGFFYLARFMLLPCALYWLSLQILPDYAIGIFLLALMPAGVTSPAMVNIFSGNVSLALMLVVVTSLLSPLVVPSLVSLTNLEESLAIDSWALFGPLVLVVFLPLIVHLPFRKWPAAVKVIERNNSTLSVLLVVLVVVTVFNSQKQYFLNELSLLFESLLITGCLFFVLYLAGWFLAIKSEASEKIAFAVSSGANNIALAITLAFLHFPPRVCLFLVFGELTWVLGLVVFRRWLRTRC